MYNVRNTEKMAKQLKVGDVIRKPTELNPAGDEIIRIKKAKDSKTLVLEVAGWDGLYMREIRPDQKIKVYNW